MFAKLPNFYMYVSVCVTLCYTCAFILLQVAELKRKLAELGLDNKGTKAELIARVEKYLAEQGTPHTHVLH